MFFPIRFRLSGCSVTALLLLLFSLPVPADDFSVFISDWEIRNDGMECFRILGFPSELLPDGIDFLDLLIIEELDVDITELAVIGYGLDTLYFGTIPFDMFLNPAKTFAHFQTEDSLVILSSEYPYRATTHNTSYTWLQDELVLAPFASWISDRSAELLASADSLLASGLIRDAADSISCMMYGWEYFEPAELCCRFLRAAHEASMDAPDEEALVFYDEVIYAFEVIQYDGTWFISFDSLDDFQRSDYAEFIEADELADILRDYAKLFRDNDFAADAAFDNTADVLEGKLLE